MTWARRRKVYGSHFQSCSRARQVPGSLWQDRNNSKHTSSWKVKPPPLSGAVGLSVHGSLCRRQVAPESSRKHSWVPRGESSLSSNYGAGLILVSCRVAGARGSVLSGRSSRRRSSLGLRGSEGLASGQGAGEKCRLCLHHAPASLNRRCWAQMLSLCG